MTYYCQCNNKGSPWTPSIEHLTDDLLLDILCRLPCYAAAVRCKTVSKRWRSLISNPLFLTRAFSMHREYKDKKSQSWAFLIDMWTRDDDLFTALVAPPHCPSGFSLQFLPYPAKVVATSRDLVLCFRFDPFTELGVYYICNPATKQWTALPPYGPHKKPECCSYSFGYRFPKPLWATLVCQDGGDFRVVVNVSSRDYKETRKPFQAINLVIYLSETCQWVNVEVRIEYQPYNEGLPGLGRESAVVCNGMVCLSHNTYFGAFNPFDVTDTFSGTLTAIGLPLLTSGVYHIFESNGKLVGVDDSYEWEVWKLDLNLENVEERPLEWKLVWNRYQDPFKVEGTMLTTEDDRITRYSLVGVHPYKEHLVYFMASREDQVHQLVLFDTKSKILKFLTRMPFHHHFTYFKKLDMPHWPTPVPQKRQ